MKVKLEIIKAGRRFHDGVYEIDDTASFGAAWQDVWIRARERWIAKTSSVGDPKSKPRMPRVQQFPNGTKKPSAQGRTPQSAIDVPRGHGPTWSHSSANGSADSTSQRIEI
jgi:hypothetical protein